jgi:hypothetical protein
MSRRPAKTAARLRRAGGAPWRAVLLGLVMVAGGVAACVDGDFADGVFACDPAAGADACPDGMACAADGLCRSGAAPGTTASSAGSGGAATSSTTTTGSVGGGGATSSSSVGGAGGAGCVPKTCAVDYPGQCGMLDDGCNGMLDCGCALPLTCISGACACEGSQLRLPQAASNDGFSGSMPWADFNNVLVQDGMPAKAEGITPGSFTQRLYAFDYGFDVPVGATVTGVELRVRRRGMAGSDAQIVLMAASQMPVAGVADKSAGGSWPDQYGGITYGGSTDLWGTGLDVNTVNATTFGAGLRAENTGSSNGNPRVDVMELTVHFSCD